jgi:Protein of unknown function (DUF3551)
VRKVFLIIAVLLPAAATHAGAAAYCAYAGGWAGYENCGYHTWEQCLLAVNGRGGQCMRNPHDPALWRAPFDHNSQRRAKPRR